jgi:1-deoxy-D-xylulose 5-phosphate reductoisomerase
MSKTLKTLDEKIELQQKKLEQMKAKKQQLEAREKTRLKALERKKDTRRKILAGAFFLNAAGENFMNTFVNGKTLDEFITNDNDKLLFISKE